MGGPAGMKQTAGLNDYLAAERTFLAWIRTGLALMGFGFVVARFGLFLEQIQVIQHDPATKSYGLSLWFGTALIAAGVVVTLSSAWRHTRLVRDLQRGAAARSGFLVPAIAVAPFLALVGLAMAIYLISVRGSTNVHPEGREVSMAAAEDRSMHKYPTSQTRLGHPLF
jgi:putative membrane protein